MRKKKICSNETKATHLSLIGKDDYHRDNQASKFNCGELREEFGLEYSCERCLYANGLLW